MAKLHDLLMHELETGANPLWPLVWRQHVRVGVAHRALELLDLDSGQVRDKWRSLDEVKARRKLVTGSTAAWDSLAAPLVTPASRNAFNATLLAKGVRQLNATNFRNAVSLVIPILMNRPIAKAVVDENPFPGTWPLLANNLAAELHHRNHPTFSDPEWRLLQGLLLVGFFATCRLPEAGHVADLFGEHEGVLLSVRGAFLRIPERIGPAGVIDVPVPLSTRAPGPLQLRNSWLSPLVRATADEAQLTLDRQGLLHRLMPADDVRTMPLFDMRGTSASQLADGRHASCLLYEYTVLIFLALSSIEYLLRTWAYHRNCHEPVSIALFKPNGQPNGVLEWIDDLGCGAGLRACIERLYSSDDANIRNRVLHGNLLEIHSKRKEAHLPVDDYRKYGHLRQTPDPYHPENFARHCFDCLERIDAEMTAFPVTPADGAWAQAIMLTPVELEFSRNVYCDFLGPDRERWLRTVTDYLLAVMPDLKQLFVVGFVEWLRQTTAVTPVLALVMGFAFEALHRLTLHLLRADAIDTQEGTLQKSHNHDGSVSHFQYRMLDTRPAGLYSPAALDLLVAHVPPADRDAARRVFLLAMKARNALAHGALTQTDQYTLDALGNLFAKATQTLVTAGLDHLTREAAYFMYENEHPGVHGRELDDWDRGWRAIQDQIVLRARSSCRES